MIPTTWLKWIHGINFSYPRPLRRRNCFCAWSSACSLCRPWNAKEGLLKKRVSFIDLMAVHNSLFHWLDIHLLLFQLWLSIAIVTPWLDSCISPWLVIDKQICIIVIIQYLLRQARKQLNEMLFCNMIWLYDSSKIT